MNNQTTETFEKGYFYGVGPRSGIKKRIGVVDSQFIKERLIFIGKRDGYRVEVEGNNVTFYPGN